jgi:Tat protein secretion system quality control protein TatD with DNase activity
VPALLFAPCFAYLALILHSTVVHSYTGSWETARVLIEELDLFIGLNGCSLRTAENLEVAAKIPLDRILIETGMWD